MSDLRWSWLAAPYLVCAIALVGLALAAALLRGDRVLRLAVIGGAITTLPWAVSQGLAACTGDPAFAWRILRLGHGTVGMIGPNLMLVLLGLSGQLERYRWVARIAGIIGLCFLVACWTTNWVVPGVQVLPSGMFYIDAGPLTGVHLSQLGIWLVVGLVIARRSAARGERAHTLRLFLGVLACGAIGSVDILLLYRVAGVFPIAWLPASLAAGIALYLVLRTDFLRLRGFDQPTAIELAFSLAAFALLALLVWFAGTSLGVVALGATAWAVLTGIAWAIARAKPVRVTGERELEQFIARVSTLDNETHIAERLSALWRSAIGVEVRTLWWRDGDALVSHSGARWTLEPEVASWLVRNNEALAMTDLATMRLGPIRDKIEALGAAHGAGVIVPLVDRDELVGMVEAEFDLALRESDRGLIADSARVAARAITFAALARAADRERETAREVEVADALRLQASASRDAELGGWAVAAEYRTASRTTGAGWAAIELADGRLALLATEAQTHGVAAALATAALTGAFAAATSGGVDITLQELITALRASSEGVLRGGQPVAAFLAILDARAQTIEYACAGHPGAALVGPIAAIDTSLPLGSDKRMRPRATPLTAEVSDPSASLAAASRLTAQFPPDTLLVVASSALRGADEAGWLTHLRDVAPASGRLASALVDLAGQRGEPEADLLAIIVRPRHAAQPVAHRA